MPDQLALLHSLRDVASRINSGGDLAKQLTDLVRAACEHGGWSMGSIMAVDLAHGYTTVVARHDPTLLRRPLEDRWELATSPALVALRRSEPVYLPDARVSEDYPGYRREAFERDYHSVLVMPMTCADPDGRPMVLSVVSRAVKPVSDDELAFMGMIVHLGAIAVEREHRLRQQAQEAEQLQGALQTQSALLQEVLSGGSNAALMKRLAELLQYPVIVVDFSANELLATTSPLAEIYSDEAWRLLVEGEMAEIIIASARAATKEGRAGETALDIERGGRRPRLPAHVEPLEVDGQIVGCLLVFGEWREEALRRLMLDSAKFALSVQMMRSVIRFRFETRTLTELLFEIVERRWRDAADVDKRARHLGLVLSRPLRMIVIDFPGGASGDANIALDCHNTVLRLARQQNLAGHVVAVGWGLIGLMPQQRDDDPDRHDRLARRIAEALRHVFGREPIVVLGGVCAGLEEYPPEWERCWRMVHIARAFGRTGVLSAMDFGPLPLLIGAADATEVRTFVETSIGAMVAHDRAHGTPYRETLAAYVRSGCRSQPCADAMALHVTTLRYRLTRIADLFGIDLDTPERRFSIELALQLHELIQNKDDARPR